MAPLLLIRFQIMLLSRSSCVFFENFVTYGAISFAICAAVGEEVLFAGKDKMEEEFLVKVS